MRRGVVLICFLLAFLPALGEEVDSSKQEETPKYVGVKQCRMCHSQAIMSGVEYLKWKKRGHSKAYTSLTTEEAKKLGAAIGVTDPANSEKCLKCHIATLEFKTPKEREEGVGCERCHGPGSLYKKTEIMKDYEASISAGMRRIKGGSDEETLKNIEKLCRECHGVEHKDENPAAKEFNFEERWSKVRHDEETLKKEFPDAFKQAAEKKEIQ